MGLGLSVIHTHTQMSYISRVGEETTVFKALAAHIGVATIKRPVIPPWNIGRSRRP